MKIFTSFFTIAKSKLRNCNSLLVAFLLFLGTTGSAIAQTNTFNVTSGAWNTAGNWSLGIIPTSAQDVVIPSGREVTGMSSGTGNVCKTLTVNGTLTFSGGNPRSIIVSGNVTVASTGVVNMTGSNGYYIDYNGASFSVASGATLNMTSTGEAGVRYTGTSASTITNSSASAFGSLLVSGTGVLTTGSAITFGKTITINSGCTFAASHTVTANAAVSVAGSFQLNNGGWATGTGTWTYTSSTGTLRFANTSGAYTVNNGDVFWPTSAGPYNVNVSGVGGGLLLNSANRIVPTTGTTGTFQTSAAVSLSSSSLTLNGTAQINASGSFSNTPIYGSSSTLIYASANTSGTPYVVGNEWTTSGAAAGAGLPNNVTIQNNTFITMPSGNRGIAGTFNNTSGSGITLNATTGDLGVGGNFTQNGTFTHSNRAVNFYGSGTQTITGANINSTGATNCFAYLLNNNSAAGGLVIGVNATIDAATGDVLQMLNTGPLKIGAFTLTINGNGGNILVSGGTRVIDFTNASGVLKIKGTSGTLKTVITTGGGLLSVTSSTPNGQVQIEGGGLDCGSGLTTIQTGALLTINSGGYVANNSATYATGSTLSFRNGASYGVGSGDKTWGIGTSGAGIPDKVEINAASTNVSINEDRTARTSVTVTSGTLTNNSNALNIATTVTTGATALSIPGGTVTNGGGTINIGPTGGGNQILSITASGVLTISGGTVNLNGNGVFSSGTFNMSGSSNFNIDPNSGTLATSVGSGTTVLAITSVTMNATGGTITFVDPPNAGTAKTLSYSQTGSVSMTGNTIVVGGASGTNTTTATVGFAFDTYVSSGRLQLGNVTIAGGNTTDRYMSGPNTTADEVNIGGTITINSGSELRIGTADEFHIAGNIVNNGTLTTLNTATAAAASALNFEKQSTPTSNTVAQTVSGSGTFRNSTSASTAKFSSLTFDNTASGSAVTFSIGDVSVSSAASFVNGIIDIGNNNSFNFVGTGSLANRTAGYVLIQGTGQMKKDLSGSSSFIFHVGENTGTTEYSPASLNFTALSPASTIGVRPVDGATASTGHPNLNDVDTQTDYISRWWQVSNSAATTYTYTGTFTYLPADVNGTETNIKANMWSGSSPWTQVSSAAASNVLTISSGVTQAQCPLGATADFTGRVKGASLYTWDGSTDSVWTTAANWTPDRTTPSSSDILVFDGSTVATPTVTAVTAETIGKLLLTNNANVTLQSSAAITLTISGGIGTDLDIPSGSHLQLGSTAANSINLAFSGTQTASIAGQFSLLTNSSNNNTYTVTNSTTTVTGTINNFGVVSGGTTSNLLFTTGTYKHLFTTTNGTIPTATWSSTSTCSIEGYTTNTTIPTGTAQTFGNFTWNTPNQNTGSINLTNNIVAITGNFTVIATGTTTARELRMGGTGSTTLPIGGNLDVQGGQLVLTSSTGTQTYTVAGNFTQSGGTLDFAAGAGATTLKVAGTFNQSAGTATESSTGSGTIEFNGSSSQSVTASGATILNTINIRVSNPAGIAVTGTLPLNAGTTFTAGSSGTAVTSGTVTYSTTTTLAYVTAVGTQTTGAEFPATSGPVNLTINNTFTTPNVTLSGSRTVTGLTITAGRIFLGNNDLTSTGTLTVSTPGATKMIVIDGSGLYKRSIATGAATYLFPIGENTGTIQYSPISLQFTANSDVRIVGAKVIDAISGNMNTPSTPPSYLSRYWTFSENGVGGTYNYYINPAIAITGSEDEVGTASSIKPSYWNGSAWTTSAGTYTSGSLVSNATGVSETAAPLGTVEWSGRENPAVSYTWVGFTDGVWGTPANWNPSGVPGSTDSVTLANGSTGNNANLNLTSAVSVTNLTFDGSGSFFNVGSAGSLTASGNITYTGGTGSWDPASTFVISSSSSQTIPAFTYGNLTTSGGARVWSSGITGIAGTFTPGAGAYTATSGSTVDYIATTGSQTIASVNYYNLSNSGNGARTLTTGTIDVANVYTPTTAATTPGTANIFNFSSISSQTIPASSYANITNTGNGPRILASSGIIGIAGGTFTPGSGAYTVTGSTVNFSNGTFLTIPALTPAATNNYNNLTVSGAGTFPLAASTSVGGIFAQSAGTVLIAGSSSITLGVTGNFNLSGGTCTVSSGAGTGALNIGGDMNVSGTGIINVTNSASAPNTTVSVTGDLNISNTARVLLEATSTASTASVINVTGNFGCTATGTGTSGPIDWGVGSANSTLSGNNIKIGGNFTKSGGGTFYTTGGTSGTAPTNFGFIFNKNGTQTFSYTGAASDYTCYTINSGSTLQLNADFAMGTSTSPPQTTFTVNGMYDMQAFKMTGMSASANAVFTLASGATLKTANTLGIDDATSSSSLGGLSTSATKTYNVAANYEFTTSSAAQTANFPTAVTTMNNLTVNNTAFNVKTNKSITVNGNLTFTAGNLDLNGSNNITLGTSANIVSESNTARLINSGSPTATNGYIGTTRTLVANPGNVGNIGLNISTAGAMGSTVIKRFPKVVSSIPTSLSSISRVYSILPATASSVSTIALSYFDGELNGNTETAPSMVTFNSTGTNETVGSSYGYIGATATDATANTVTYNAANLTTTNTFWTCLNTNKYETAQNGPWNTPATWVGTSVPPANVDVTIKHAVTVPALDPDPLTVNSLTINSGMGVSLTVYPDRDLTVKDAIVNNGTLTIENNANLMQTNNVANTGSGSTIVKRNSSLLKRLDYTLWSSPVTGQGLYAFSKYTLPNRFYVYNTASDAYSNSLVGFSFNPANFEYPSPLISPNGVNGVDDNNVQFANGKGYLIRVPYNHPTEPAVYNGIFTGVANNGDISATVSTALNGYNAVGNPYPSRLNVWNFIDGNTNITGPLYFWRKTNNPDPLSNAYATLTKIAYTANGSPGGDTGTGFFPTGGSQEQNWVINIGQGFIVKATSGSTINFTNSMRRSSNADQFFKDNQTVNDVSNGLYWLNLNTSLGSYSQMAVGYSSEATLDFDRGIDGENINNEFYLTSLIGTGEYSIQGRPNFDSSDVVPLSYKAATSGNYSISIDHTDGLFTDVSQPIYVKDNLTATYHDLNTGAYSFVSEAGTFNDRFEIVYALPLGVDNPTFTANAVVIYPQNNDLVVNSGNVTMSSIKIFDIRGRLLQDIKGINSSQTTISAGLANEVLLVQITSDDGIVVTKKVIR